MGHFLKLAGKTLIRFLNLFDLQVWVLLRSRLLRARRKIIDRVDIGITFLISLLSNCFGEVQEFVEGLRVYAVHNKVLTSIVLLQFIEQLFVILLAVCSS
jgi:hypothetical protein